MVFWFFLGFGLRHLSKTQNGLQKQRSGQYALARQKIYKKTVSYCHHRYFGRFSFNFQIPKLRRVLILSLSINFRLSKTFSQRFDEKVFNKSSWILNGQNIVEKLLKGSVKWKKRGVVSGISRSALYSSTFPQIFYFFLKDPGPLKSIKRILAGKKLFMCSDRIMWPPASKIRYRSVFFRYRLDSERCSPAILL